ncbi:acyltransferase family protein [Paraburkholderia acidipaludis]|uniref:acyltransferase family protein n=1 Tax=Paraburkholderia acidipaludis TaxID=660537 RepID=UPI00047FA427|nr:acyltransferase [Paraburkholderia acidipaludis]
MATDRRINEIDLLRFLAALGVVFYHYAFRGHAADDLSVVSYPALVPIVKYAYLGVDLFFMISGFVIFMTVSSGSLRHFIVSRVTKLYPAFWICCTITFFVSLTIGGARFPVSLTQYLINMAGLGAFGAEPVDGVYWSLCVEMKFYALVAVMLMSGAMKRAPLLLWLWLAISVFATWRHLHAIQNVLIADNAALFIAGAALYQIWSGGWSISIGMLLGAAICVSTAQAVHRAAHIAAYFNTPIDPFVVAAIMAVFFVVMLLIATGRTGRLGERRWVLLGALSYPLYLVHQNVGYMVFNAVSPMVGYQVAFWGMVVTAIVMAYVVHTCAERPLAASMKRRLRMAFGGVVASTSV